MVAAVAGFAIGDRQHSSSAPATTAGGGISNAGLVLEPPRGWSLAPTAPGIKGLRLGHQLALAPGGRGVREGLLTGTLEGGGEAPLPSAFLATLPDPPHTQVLNLTGAQAYRYTGLKPAGEPALELYVVPGTSSGTAVLACYAPSAQAPVLAQCDGIVTGLVVNGVSQNELVPDPGYASRLAGVVGALDRSRTELRGQLAQASRAAKVKVLATSLADSFQAAFAALRRVEPPLAAAQVAAALTGALASARDAYRALATAASREEPGSYALARERLARAEGSVDSALESFTLIGYGR